jgi:IS5 family transposase
MNRNTITFADHDTFLKIQNRKNKPLLFELNEIFDWEAIRNILSVADLRNNRQAGRDCYDPMMIFKAMLIQSIYGMKDRALEEHLVFNGLFQWFCGFSSCSNTPDHSTICRWRDRFVKLDIYSQLFSEINNQLDTKGFQIKGGQIIDATLIEA